MHVRPRQCTIRVVVCIFHHAFRKFGHDPKHLQHQYFPEQMVKETDTKTRARLHGNAATKKKWQGFQGGSAKN